MTANPAATRLSIATASIDLTFESMTRKDKQEYCHEESEEKAG